MPQGGRHTMSDNDKHLLATLTGGFAIGILVAVALRMQGVGGDDAFFGVALAGFCGGLAAGIGKEYGDECAENNKWDWQDIAADCIGSLVGGGLAAILGVIF